MADLNPTTSNPRINANPSNLNKIEILSEFDPVQQNNFGCSSFFGETRVYFKDLERHLIGHIASSPIIVGCVAWLTSVPILRSLAKCKAVSIVVQKEDFLRPDANPRKGFAKKLRGLYDALPSELSRYNKSLGRLSMMSYATDPSVSAVRCVGNHNQDKSPAFPRMHHKFLVFCRYEGNSENEPPDEEDTRIIPCSAWTGSFNLTANSSNSFENAVYLTDRNIVQAYFMEWSQIAALSESLDWDNPWCEPQWKIGT